MPQRELASALMQERGTIKTRRQTGVIGTGGGNGLGLGLASAVRGRLWAHRGSQPRFTAHTWLHTHMCWHSHTPRFISRARMDTQKQLWLAQTHTATPLHSIWTLCKGVLYLRLGHPVCLRFQMRPCVVHFYLCLWERQGGRVRIAAHFSVFECLTLLVHVNVCVCVCTARDLVCVQMSICC